MMIDAFCRYVPGVLGNQASVHTDSFGGGIKGLLEFPLYTRPETFEGLPVPAVLKSGNHKEIERWRKEKALEKTKSLRPDLLDKG